jgi:putative nucleotidyltransferase with HDIG domain
MRAVAERLGEDPDIFGLAGLVHDLDLDECENDLGRHALLGAEILRELGTREDVVQAVLGHNDKAERTTLTAKALWVVDPTTGMITASALVRPSKSTVDLNVKSIKKRMKDNRFAANLSRSQINACQEQLGLPLDEFLKICLDAMNGIRDQIGL